VSVMSTDFGYTPETCGSWLASDGPLSGAEKSSGRDADQTQQLPILHTKLRVQLGAMTPFT